MNDTCQTMTARTMTGGAVPAGIKRIAILGSTGSIGQSTADVVRRYPDRFSVVALTARNSIEELERQIREFTPLVASVESEDLASRLRDRLGGDVRTRILWGLEGHNACASLPEADLVLSAIVGTAGLQPTLAAVGAGKTVALANKESLVAAGDLMRREADRSGAVIVPVDSEHSAIFQCLDGRSATGIRRVVLTASGGAFRDFSAGELEGATAEQALRHPNWTMGPKVTVDSATLMNKGLEVIEARWLFDLPPDAIDVIIHPESIVHSFVEFLDGSVIAQMGVPDMRGPIAYALSYPERLDGVTDRLDLVEAGGLSFRKPDAARFPCLGYAYEALRAGGILPAAMNAANEVAVAAFLGGTVTYPAIARIIRTVMDGTTQEEISSLDQLLGGIEKAEARARAEVERLARDGRGGRA